MSSDMKRLIQKAKNRKNNRSSGFSTKPMEKS